MPPHRSWVQGSTRAWRRTRALILTRDNHTCRVALPPWGPRPDQRCQGVADCVHHLQGRAVTGDDPTYLVASCTPCNLHIGEPNPDPTPAPRTRW